jgi:hypothetical protein
VSEPDEQAIAAAGKMTEAFETLERARGHLYSFHQLVGRNVLPGRWTFEVVEEFDDGYWSVFRDFERAVRDALVGGRRHLHEARMKHERQ